MTSRVLAAALLFTAAAAAQTKLKEGLAGNMPPGPPVAEPTETVYALTLKAVGPPAPALKYELLVNPRDTTRANAALLYHRAIHLMAENRKPGKEGGEERLRIDHLFEKPMTDIPAADLREYLKPFGSALREAEAAAKCRDCEWGLGDRLTAEGIAVLIPEIQKMRELAFLLKVRCRLHVLDGNTAGALHDIQTGLTMAKHVSRSEMLISYLVGNAVAAIMLNELNVVLEAPGCPNVYWALTALPRPLLPMDAAVEGEMRSMDAMIGLPANVDEPMTADQARLALDTVWAKMTRLSDDLGAAGMPRMKLNESRVFLAGYVTLTHPAAKKSLLAAGKTDAEVAAMPAAQVVLLDSAIRYRNLRDQYMMWLTKPYEEGAKGLKTFDESFKKLKERADYLNIMLGLLMPAVQKVYDVQWRTERRVASLRVVEAVRLHAAATGKVPAKLEDITAVPVPNDPVTGKPFAYALTAAGFTVTVGPPPGHQSNRGNAWKYQITWAK